MDQTEHNDSFSGILSHGPQDQIKLNMLMLICMPSHIWRVSISLFIYLDDETTSCNFLMVSNLKRTSTPCRCCVVGSDSCLLNSAASKAISHESLLFINDSLLLREACCLSAVQRQLRSLPMLPSPPLVHRSTVTLQGSQMKTSHCDLWDVISRGTRWAPPSCEVPLGPKHWPSTLSPEGQ